jgi:hypothetical protein
VSGDVLFFREILAHAGFEASSWYFGVELVTFVVKGTELCRLTVAALESLSDSSVELRE